MKMVKRADQTDIYSTAISYQAILKSTSDVYIIFLHNREQAKIKFERKMYAVPNANANITENIVDDMFITKK